MAGDKSNSATRAPVLRSADELSDSKSQPRSVRSATNKRWQPPEVLSPDELSAVVAAASCERGRLPPRVNWATGARVSEALALWPNRRATRQPGIAQSGRKASIANHRAGPNRANCVCGQKNSASQTTSRSSSLGNARSMAHAGALQRGQAWLMVDNKPFLTKPTSGFLRCGHRSMVKMEGLHPCIPISFAMRASVRSCATRESSRFPSGRPGGQASNQRTSPWR